MKILIIGANGMLGHTLHLYMSKLYEVLSVSRGPSKFANVLTGYDINSLTSFDNLLENFKPQIVINCAGIIKQLSESKNYKVSIKTNALWPHELADLCLKHDSKLIHFSTDCVFDGLDGNYSENSPLSAKDLYGISKYLGEVNYDHCLTLRTSIIGHELASSLSLVDWFLSQKDSCYGYKNAIYSGFPTIEICEILNNHIFIPLLKGEISGVHNLSSDSISKFELLKIISKVYNKKIDILENAEFQIDRSLNSDSFKKIIAYESPDWIDLIKKMHTFYQENSEFYKK